MLHGKEKTQKAFGTLHNAPKLVLIISRIHKVKATSFTKCKRLEKLLPSVQDQLHIERVSSIAFVANKVTLMIIDLE
jgi:hypothetical protein